MKKVIITPGITDLNRGDQALIWLIKDILKEGGFESECILLQSGNNDEEIYIQSKQSMDMGFNVLTPILLHPARGKEKKDNVGYTLFTKLSWGATGLKDMFKSALLLSKIRFIRKFGAKLLNKNQKESYQEFKKMDLLIVKGGGFLHTYKRLSDLYYLYYSLFNIMLAKRLEKKIIIMPNSFGPFLGNLEKKIVKRVLDECDLIYSRESISENYLSTLLEKEVKLSPDLGFYIKEYGEYRAKPSNALPTSNKKVAITMRPYRFPETGKWEEKYKQYIQEMFKTTIGLIDRGYHPVLVAHTLGPSAHEDDRLAIEEVIKLLETNEVSSNNYSYINDLDMNCYDITNLYSQTDYIIGTRFHSVIFAMTSLIPAIAISYSGHKAMGIMSDMGLSEYTVEISNIKAESVLSKFDNLTLNEIEVREKIKRYLEVCETEKEKLINEIKIRLT